MKKRFWLSFDLGIDGDYDSLYGWLDSNSAHECGDGLASFTIDIGNAKDIPSALLKIAKRHIKLRSRDRLYLIWREEGGKKVKGKFIHGQRHRAQWAGYAVEGAEETEDVE